MNHKSATPPPLETKIEEIKEGAEMSVDIDGKRYEDVGAILSDFLPGRLDEKIRLTHYQAEQGIKELVMQCIPYALDQNLFPRINTIPYNEFRDKTLKNLEWLFEADKTSTKNATEEVK